MGKKDCKDYSNSGEGIGWKCGHRKDVEGTNFSQRKLYGWQVNAVKNREDSGKKAQRGSITFTRDRSCKVRGVTAANIP